jgi:diguanylate cyclase (GGDEF)-like protein
VSVTVRTLPLPVRYGALIALYVVGAAIANALTLKPHDIVLVWPASGVGFAALLLFGLRAWPVIAIGVALAHLLVSPVPLKFLPLSVLANTLACTLAAALVRRYSNDPLSLRLKSGLLNLLGCCVLALTGGILGALGLYFSDMIGAADVPRALLRWALGDLYGTIVFAPTLMLLWRSFELGRVNPNRFRYARWPERALWIGALVLACWLVLQISARSPAFALGMNFLPLTLLIWAALRFEPVTMAAATSVTSLGLAAAAGLGLGGFSAPRSTVEVVVLMLYLSLLALIPLLFGAVSHDARMKQRALLERATTDRLTGLGNRAAFEEALDRSLREPNAIDRLVLHIDLDQFKVINDTVSHRAGDELIRQIASLLRAELSREATVARLGGDEFGVIVASDSDINDRALTQRLRERVSQFRGSAEAQGLAVTTSIGAVRARSGADPADVLRAADTACFSAKERGGNRVSFSDGLAPSAEAQAMHWVVKLNHALDHDQFVLYCQSIAPLNRANEPGAHCEILLRLQDGETLLKPGEFILAAERFKLIDRIDRYVVKRTLDWFDAHPHAQPRLVAINVSSATVADEQFPEFLETRLRASRLRANQLCLEITETSAIKDLAHARGFIERLKALGVRFALDDFGSGFCSFGYLKSLDVDYLKIDGSFVRALIDSPLDRTVIHAIVDIARVLGKQTVAECAETAEIRAALKAVNVDYVQGHAIDEPMPIERYFSARVDR